jgi:hypothetical protein
MDGLMNAGSVKNGIILLPDNRSMIYALGSTIVKRDIVNSHDQQFLQVRQEHDKHQNNLSKSPYTPPPSSLHNIKRWTHAVMPRYTRQLSPAGDMDDLRMSVFLQGHSDRVTCMSLSPSGKYLASGQVTHLGFQADVIVWDLETLEIAHRLRLHKVFISMVGKKIAGSLSRLMHTFTHTTGTCRGCRLLMQ